MQLEGLWLAFLCFWRHCQRVVAHVVAMKDSCIGKSLCLEVVRYSILVSASRITYELTLVTVHELNTGHLRT